MSEPAWKRKAVQAQVLYLANLLALPGIAFAILVWLWWPQRNTTVTLERCHVESAFRGSVLAGMLILCVVSMMLLWGDFNNPYFWVMVVIYFTTVHSALVLIGVVGLTKALANKPFYFPGAGVRHVA